MFSRLQVFQKREQMFRRKGHLQIEGKNKKDNLEK